MGTSHLTTTLAAPAWATGYRIRSFRTNGCACTGLIVSTDLPVEFRSEAPGSERLIEATPDRRAGEVAHGGNPRVSGPNGTLGGGWASGRGAIRPYRLVADRTNIAPGAVISDSRRDSPCAPTSGTGS
jgi:hypothetical protein